MTYRLGNETVFEPVFFCILDTGIVSEMEEGQTRCSVGGSGHLQLHMLF